MEGQNWRVKCDAFYLNFIFFSPSRDFACIFNLATTLWHARSAISSASSREQCGKGWGGEGLAGKGGDPNGLLTLE